MLLRVRSITYLAEAINGYELVDPRGRDLPRFAAGAHIAVRHEGAMRQAEGAARQAGGAMRQAGGAMRQAGGAVRDYSLWNDPAERRRYCMAVLRERDGQGSRHWHDGVRVGDLVEASTPRNNFPLTEGAERYLLLAGGIGVTPIMAMIAELRRRRADFLVHYCTRSPQATAFRDELDLLAAQGRVCFHHDGGDAARGLDIAAALKDPQPGTHLYYCGPSAMMRAAAEASADWPPGTVHCEYFSGPSARPAEPLVEDRPFRVRLVRSGREYEIPAGHTIIDVLRRNDVAVRTSCELGYCASCLTPYVGGEPDHRDQILSEADRLRYVLICCSRAKTPVLELDL
jgi:vanillate O-demethylase ferredoxin subunit